MWDSASLLASFINVKGDGRKVKQSQLELHKRTGRGGGLQLPQSSKKMNFFRAKLVDLSGTTET